MRLARFSTDGGPIRVGALVGDEIADLTDALGQSVSVDALMTSDLVEAQRAADRARVREPLATARLHAPIARPPKFLAIGLNYDEHAAEARTLGMDRPDAMIVFNKQSTCITGPFDPIEKPSVSDQLDYEGELGFVIGRRCRRVPVERAHEVIAGYLVLDDVSVRDWQRATPTMTMGKSWDTHGPSGPWLTTADEIDDPHGLDLSTWVDGELRQSSNTRHLMNDCFAQVAHLSRVVTLEPGDIVATGTPAGVGIAMDPPGLLRVGDVVRVQVEGLGAIENRVIEEPVAAPWDAQAPTMRWTAIMGSSSP